MKTNNPATACDAYKIDHRRQYPDQTSLVFSNLTARGTRVEGVEKVGLFGLQYFIQEYLLNEWNDKFFNLPVEDVVKSYNRRVLNYVGPNEIGDQHIRDLHALGHLPIEIWAIPEGEFVDLRVPSFVMFNTDARFFWITNALETILSTTIWGPCTSLTTAVMYRNKLNAWAEKTNPEMLDFVQWQGHDFSFRGHFGMEAAIMSAAAHVLAFTGSDTVPCVDFLEEYYGADSDKELVAGSVAATEHAVACANTGFYTELAPDTMVASDEYFDYVRNGEDVNEDKVYTLTEKDKLRWAELKMVENLITVKYPTGVISLVMDTFDFWNVIDPDNGILVTLKDKIMARDGKVVIRPDSGDPVKIVTGWKSWEVVERGGVYYHYKEGIEQADMTRPISHIEVKGMIQCLYEIFGGEKSSTGYIQLDSHIGGIYGDSITLERAEQISQRLADKWFASTNLVYGIGSFTYQGAVTPDAIITRDTHCFAVKATYTEIEDNGGIKGIEIFKDPVTDSGLKKSAKGLTAVYKKGDNSGYVMKDQASWDDIRNCAFVQVFKDGVNTKEWTLGEIRERVAAHIETL